MTRLQAWILILLVAVGVSLLGFKYYTDDIEAKQKNDEANAQCIQTCSKTFGGTGGAYQSCFNSCLVEADYPAWKF